MAQEIKPVNLKPIALKDTYCNYINLDGTMPSIYKVVAHTGPTCKVHSVQNGKSSFSTSVEKLRIFLLQKGDKIMWEDDVCTVISISYVNSCWVMELTDEFGITFQEKIVPDSLAFLNKIEHIW